METPETFFTQKNAKFCCALCDFKCFKQSDWNRHINTIKHIHSHNGNDLEALGNIFTPKNAEFVCDCGRVYNSNSGLWKHKKKCNIEKIEVNNNHETLNITPELILDIIQQNQEFKELLIKQNKENQELQKQILEVCKKIN